MCLFAIPSPSAESSLQVLMLVFFFIQVVFVVSSFEHFLNILVANPLAELKSKFLIKSFESSLSTFYLSQIALFV